MARLTSKSPQNATSAIGKVIFHTAYTKKYMSSSTSELLKPPLLKPKRSKPPWKRIQIKCHQDFFCFALKLLQFMAIVSIKLQHPKSPWHQSKGRIAEIALLTAVDCSHNGKSSKSKIPLTARIRQLFRDVPGSKVALLGINSSHLS